MAFLCSIKQLHLLFPLHLWFCLLLLCLYLFLFLPRFNILAPSDDSPARELPSSDNNYSTISYLSTTEDDDVNIEEYPFLKALETENNRSDPCGGRYIYVHDLPPKFNEDIIKDCENLFKYTNMCSYVENNGLGRKLDNAEGEGGVFSKSGWYDTDQFTLEPIFYHRMKQYDCLTHDSSIAAAIYVPFYAGCDISRHFFGYSNEVKDALSYELANWLKNTCEWGVMGGKDHFLVAGRVTWEFRRLTNNDSDWGNQLLLLPEFKNMSTLLVESNPWDSNDFAIPYPTYFHPFNDTQMIFWQDWVRKIKRQWLFSFAGAPRLNDPNSIRTQILNQCKHSKVCKLLECAVGDDKNCHSPEKVMHLFQSSHFCLQPQGDTPTRRSTFDAILAGCIPVFFNPGSAYEQYTWHLPNNYSKYSVFISEDDIRKKNVSIEETLENISPEIIEQMREEIIDFIPKIVYADPRSKSRTFKDAFDVSVEAVIRRVTKLRWDIVQWPQG